MTLDLLIQAIVRQTTILIAQLATSHGTRAPLAQIADQVFLELVRELERQGVSRKVSADMFGLGLRTYQRKIQRLTETTNDRRRSLWIAILDFLALRSRSTTRAEVMLEFADEDEALVRGVLHDLCETGLVSVAGTGPSMTYVRTPEDEIARLCQVYDREGLDELLWALIYREGPQTLDALASKYGERDRLEPALLRLLRAGRISCDTDADGAYSTQALALPLGTTVGWEAAVFDHFQAMVRTIIARLRQNRTAAMLDDRVGGSTYTLEVWPGHPYEADAYATLAELRSKIGDLRRNIESYNAEHEIPDRHVQVSLYVGQCLTVQGNDLDENS